MKLYKKLIVGITSLFIGMAAFSFAPTAAQAKDMELTCEAVYPLMMEYLDRHYVYKKLTPELETRTVTQFIKTLDPSKLYFTAEDVAQIKKSFTHIFEQLNGEKCDPIFAAETLYKTRVQQANDWAKKSLENGFKFEPNTTIALDPQKRAYPKDVKAEESIQTTYLQFQISNYLATDMKLDEAKKQLEHRYELMIKQVDEQKPDDLLALFLDSFATSLDPHSNFLSKDTLEDFEITMRLSLEGIGATLSNQDGYTVIENLIPGGAAAKSGQLEPKDKIIAVGQGDSDKDKVESVIDMPLRDVVKKIRGPKGTKVRLSILRQGKTVQHFVVKLTRDKIDLKDEAAKLSYMERTIHQKKYKLGVIDLPSFYEDSETGSRSCAQDVRNLIEQAEKNHVDGIVLDLSRNGGGVLGEAVRVAGLFIKKGNIVATQDSDGKVQPLPDTDATMDYPGPLVVLTSRLSASASEIVAGALKDYHRAVIIGSDHTFGKGSVQSVMKLRDNLGAIKVTTGMFFTPGGASTQEKGVASDVKIPSPYMTKEFSEDALDYALPKKSIKTFLSTDANNPDGQSHFTPVAKWMIAKLSRESRARVSKDPEFAKITKDLKDTEKKNGVIKLADLMKKNEADNKKDKQNAKKADNGEDADYLTQPAMKEAANVLADLIELESKGLHLADHSSKNENAPKD